MNPSQESDYLDVMAGELNPQEVAINKAIEDYAKTHSLDVENDLDQIINEISTPIMEETND